MPKPNLLVTFDSMRDANRGYHSFGRGLGDALIQRNNGRFSLNFYLFKDTPYTFRGEVKLLFLSAFHRLFFPARNRFDVVHFTDHTFRLPAGRVNAKKVMTLHDMNKVHLKANKPRSLNRYLKRLKGNMQLCDRIVAISQFVADDVLRYFPEMAPKISVIYNGADRLTVPANHQPAHKPAGDFLFTIGLLSVAKGFHLLPPLLAGNDYILCIAGIETPHKAAILREASKYHCEDRILITGPVSDEDKAWYYQHCSAFVFPSRAEGFGLPVIEAMHFGKPVFLSEFTSLPEIGGDAAYYFNSFEPDHMQQVFKRGMADFKDRNRAGEMIKRAALFTWEAAADQYLQLYKDCLGS